MNVWERGDRKENTRKRESLGVCVEGRKKGSSGLILVVVDFVGGALLCVCVWCTQVGPSHHEGEGGGVGK